MEFFLNNPALATYLFLKVDTLNSTLGWATIICLILFLAFAFCLDSATGDEFPKEMFRCIKISFVCFLVSLVCWITTPTKQQVAIMIGVTAGVSVYKEVSSSPITQKAYQVLLSYAEAELDSLISKNEKKGSN